MAKPATQKELAELVAAGGRFELMGSGSKRGLGRPMPPATILDMSGFNGITLYEHDELVLDAGAATPLDDIEKTLAKNHQQLAFEPPDYSKLLGATSRGTLGGLMACGLSGPRRIKAGAARDHILGFTGVSGRGEMFKAGGRVVKNVTGFDISKLMAGSYGTLAAMTGITMKVLPAAETEETLVLSGLDDARAITVMSLALQSSCEVSGAAHIPGNPALTFLRLEGVRPSVFYRRDKLALLLKDFAACDVLALDKSRVQWLAIRDVHPLADEQQRHVWRLSVAPSLGAATVAKISAGIDARYYYDWAGGLIWLSLPASADASVDIVRGSFQEGHATLMRAPEDVRARVEVFQPQGEALAALTARVKNSFDPAGAFNFGRMYRNH